MVSEEAREVILLYDQQMPFFFLALFDTEKEESVSYYCPVLAEDADGGKEALYQIKRREGYEIRICEELAESLLERGAVGMELGESRVKTKILIDKTKVSGFLTFMVIF